jgi:hypothetical protein
MIDTHIGNRSDAIRLIFELAIELDRCVDACPNGEDYLTNLGKDWKR